MCDLLGLSFSTDISARISLDIFQDRGRVNPDGWGMAFYYDKSLRIIKEAQSALNSPLFDFMERYIHSKTIISHVRRSTRGIPSYLNTHPFYREMNIGHTRQEYSFAHNGTLTNLARLSTLNCKPLGETDSELAFCYIIETIQNRGIQNWTEGDYAFLENTCRDINDDENTFNCMLSNGELLFCYSDENDHNNGLRYLCQKQPFGTIELISPDEKLGAIDIHTATPTDSLAENELGYVISTRILTEGDWTEFRGGELIVFRNGEIVYPSHRVTQSSS
ncbi:MAG: class II glutamine amidotransferase [Candidatus Thorarchaeota archaeon]|nr:class II glutamine amidotransferase [Candidatus Thorarchaeota archaeon]